MIYKYTLIIVFFVIGVFSRDGNLKGFVFSSNIIPSYTFRVNNDIKYNSKILELKENFSFGAGFNDNIGCYAGTRFSHFFWFGTDEFSNLNSLIIYVGIIAKQKDWLFTSDVGFFKSTVSVNLSAGYMVTDILELGLNIGMFKREYRNSYTMFPIGVRIGLMVF